MEGNSSKKSIPCKYYARGLCRKGESCPYHLSHIQLEISYSHELPSEKETKEREQRKRGNQAKESNRVQGSCTVHHSEVEHMMKLSGNYLLLTASPDRDVYIWDQQLAQSFLCKTDAQITAITNASGFVFLAESMISNQGNVFAVCVLSLADRNKFFIQQGLKAPVVHISYSSRYHYLYCVLSNGDIAIYNSDSSFSLITVLSLEINVTCALIQDVVVYAGGSNGELAILNMQTNERCIRTFVGVSIKSLMLISEDPSYALLIVYSDGQLSLFNLPDFALLHSGNVGSNVLAATVYKNKKDEWMLISSCQKFASDIALSVMAVNAFQPRGLMKQCTSAPVTALANIGKRGAAGDFVVAGCKDGSITVFDMSECCVC